jgi:hypothetical protein
MGRIVSKRGHDASSFDRTLVDKIALKKHCAARWMRAVCLRRCRARRQQPNAGHYGQHQQPDQDHALFGFMVRAFPTAPANCQLYMNRYWHSQDFKAVEQLKKIAADSGRSLISMSLNWLLHHTSVACIILGAARMEQLEENLNAATEGPLSEATVKACDAVWQEFRGPSPMYNR